MEKPLAKFSYIALFILAVTITATSFSVKNVYADNSCRYAYDNECDEPDYCARGTDESDCKSVVKKKKKILRNSTADACEYAFDDECDEPDLCDRGTDTTDCSDSSSSRNEYQYDTYENRRQTAPRTAGPGAVAYCCDGYGRPWCPIVQGNFSPGAPCWCSGAPGQGIICYR